jgi:hypothetical protein
MCLTTAIPTVRSMPPIITESVRDALGAAQVGEVYNDLFLGISDPFSAASAAVFSFL